MTEISCNGKRPGETRVGIVADHAELSVDPADLVAS